MTFLQEFIDTVKITVNNSEFPIYISNKDLEIKLINRSLKTKILHYGDPDKLSAIFSDEELSELNNFAMIALNQKKMATVRFDPLSSTGEDLNVRHIPIFDNKHQTIGILTLFRRFIPDTIDLKLTQQLNKVEIQDMVSKLVGGITHKLTNILTSISGVTSLLLLDDDVADMYGDKLSILSNSTYDANKHLEDLNTIAKTQSPKGELIDLEEIIQETIDLIFQNKENNLFVEVNLEKGYLSHRGQSHDLKELFFNLIINAIEAIPIIGTLSIYSRVVILNKPPEGINQEIAESFQSGKFVEITLEDDGDGIEPDNLNKIYEPYFTTKGSGRGLGLSVARRIVQSHNGFIHHINTDKGVKVLVLLPLQIEKNDNNLDTEKN